MLSAILRLCFNLATFQLQHLAIFDYITRFSLCRHFHLFSSNCNASNILNPSTSENWIRKLQKALKIVGYEFLLSTDATFLPLR